jgi:hypothetical protein
VRSLRTARARLGVGGSLETFEDEIDRAVAVYRSYRSWGQPIIDPTINQLLERRPPPRLYLSVHAFFDARGHNPIRWSDIAAGLYDADIDSWSNELLQVSAETHVYLCFHHEMEKEEGACGTPTDFQNAYWYFRNRVEVVNAVPNLTWVVMYMGTTFRGNHGGPDRWWPGTPQFGLPVDQLMGVDLYNRNTCHGKVWRPFDELAVEPWRFARHVRRPFFVGECGCVEGDDCGGGLPHGTEKAKWFESALVYMRDTAPSLGFPRLEAFCYSNVSGYRDGNYRIESSPQALSAFQALAKDPFFSKPP